MTLPPPAPGRDCGACTACCVDLKIDDPALHKPDGVRCPNLIADATCNACAIYEARPLACRTWHCGWRLLASLSEAMRPDLSGVMLVPEVGQAEGYSQGGLMFVPVGGDVGGMLADELVELAAKCVAASVPIYLSYGVGDACRRVLANPSLEPAMRAQDRDTFVQAMRAIVDELVAADASPTPAKPLRQWASGPVSVTSRGRPV